MSVCLFVCLFIYLARGALELWELQLQVLAALPPLLQKAVEVRCACTYGMREIEKSVG